MGSLTNFGLLVDSFSPHSLDLSLQFNDFVGKVSVFDLHMLQTAVVVGHSAAMFFLPLLGDLLLLNHDGVGTLLVGFVPLLDFE